MTTIARVWRVAKRTPRRVFMQSYTAAIENPLVTSRCSYAKPLKTEPVLCHNATLSANVVEALPEISTRTCIFHPAYNAAYEEDGAVVAGSQLLRYLTRAPQNAPARIDPDECKSFDRIPVAIFGGILFGRHYGHFLTETLSRLWVLYQGHSQLAKRPPILFRMAKNRGASLESVLPPLRVVLDTLRIADRIRIVTRPTLVDAMMLPGPSIINNCQVHRVYVDFLASLGARLLDGTPSSEWKGRPVYLSRRRLPWHCRRLANERQLEQVLKRSGYAVVYPERLSLHDQLALFRDAAIVAGPHGSAFHSLPLSGNRHARIRYLVESTYSGTYRHIDAAMGVDAASVHCLYAHPLCKKPSHSRTYIVDLERAKEGLLEGTGI